MTWNAQLLSKSCWFSAFPRCSFCIPSPLPWNSKHKPVCKSIGLNIFHFELNNDWAILTKQPMQNRTDTSLDNPYKKFNNHTQTHKSREHPIHCRRSCWFFIISKASHLPINWVGLCLRLVVIWAGRFCTWLIEIWKKLSISLHDGYASLLPSSGLTVGIGKQGTVFPCTWGAFVLEPMRHVFSWFKWTAEITVRLERTTWTENSSCCLKRNIHHALSCISIQALISEQVHFHFIASNLFQTTQPMKIAKVQINWRIIAFWNTQTSLGNRNRCILNTIRRKDV